MVTSRIFKCHCVPENGNCKKRVASFLSGWFSGQETKKQEKLITESPSTPLLFPSCPFPYLLLLFLVMLCNSHLREKLKKLPLQTV